jgi:hypothetical protein
MGVNTIVAILSATAKLAGLGVTYLNDRSAFVGELILGAYAPTGD